MKRRLNIVVMTLFAIVCCSLRLQAQEKQPLVVDTYASQIDIAATLLAQLGLPHDEFTFSKNILNPGSPHFAYFTRPDYFGMITADNQLVYNLDANTVQLDEGTAKGANLEKGKAFLQKLYDDLAKR